MNPEDVREYADRYSHRLAEFGYSPKTLGWGKGGRQSIRYEVLTSPFLHTDMPESTCSILDVGCGFGDLLDFLHARRWQGRYEGIDIVPDLLAVARQRHPGGHFALGDISGEPLQKLGRFDYVIASGVFNARLHGESNEVHIAKAIERMCEIARLGVFVDFMSSYVDYRNGQGWYTDPAWAFSTGKRFSRRVAIRHDYMPYEFTLYIFLNDNVSDNNVFEAFIHKGVG